MLTFLDPYLNLIYFHKQNKRITSLLVNLQGMFGASCGIVNDLTFCDIKMKEHHI